MISILVSIYNHDPSSLVQDLLAQIKNSDYPFEILVGNDGSDSKFMPVLRLLDKLPGVRCIHAEKNMGRSKIRNKLASLAKHPYLLFIDGDARVCSDIFILSYLEQAESDKVICGGTGYSNEVPGKKEEYLRWKYGISREAKTARQRSIRPYISFSSFNFFMPAEIFREIRFNENILRYGHEDTVFGIELEQKNIPVIHIDNQLIHTGLDTAEIFLKKTRESLINLKELVKSYEHTEDLIRHIRLLNRYRKIRKWGLHHLLTIIYRVAENSIHKNLTGFAPSLALLDLYKLCILNKIQA